MKKRIKEVILLTIKISAYYLSFFLVLTGSWINKRFGNPDFDQILYHVKFGFSGLVRLDSPLALDFITNCLIAPIVLTLALYKYEKFITSTDTIKLKQDKASINAPIKKLFWKIWETILKTSKIFFKMNPPLMLIIISSAIFSNSISLSSRLKNIDESNFISDNYAIPKITKTPTNKNNLILIYVESLENTYSDTELFGKDLLKSLNQKTANAISFDELKQTYGTNWTIAGMVSSQCGIPLKPIVNLGKNETWEQVGKFLPNAICLGDILKEAGYKNIFMGGAPLFFAGKGMFLQQHGYGDIKGKNEWKKLGEKNLNEWGIYDDQLLSIAKKKVTELEEGNSPYNLTILTLDTHSPGYISETCRENGAKEFVDIVECSSDMLTDFIDYMSENDYLKNTNIVILGDHLTLPNKGFDHLEKLKRKENRTIFNRFILADPLTKNREIINNFSIFPSILYSLGFRFDNNRLGLGASGFGDVDPDFIVDSMGPEKLWNELSKHSEKYLEFSDLESGD